MAVQGLVAPTASCAPGQLSGKYSLTTSAQLQRLANGDLKYSTITTMLLCCLSSGLLADSPGS